MKQTFSLPGNTKAIFFPAQFSYEMDVGKTLTNESDYSDVESIRYVHNSHIGTDLEPFFTVVVKARYQLPDSSERWTDDNDELEAIKDLSNAPVLVPHSNSASLVFADKLTKVSGGFGEPVIAENDLAIIKRSCDIIVKRFRNIKTDGLSNVATTNYKYQVEAKGQLWLQRNIGDTHPDTINWYPRFESPRKALESKVGSQLRLITNNHYFQGNTSRHVIRSVRSKLTSSDKVLLSRERIVDSKIFLTTYRFQMPEHSPVSHYYRYCGHGRDEPSQWCKENVSMSIDTLVVYPDSGYLDITWRGYWRSDVAVEQYRELKIMMHEGDA